jgi:hypothetical protein
VSPERSIKATLFQVVADDVARLLAAGTFTQAELERRLDPSDLRYLGKQLAVSSWVPMATFVRVMNAALDLARVPDRDAFMRAGGAVTAARLRETGIYRQFEVMNEPWSVRVGKILSTLGAVHYNFTRWTFEEGEGDVAFRVTATDATDLPEMLRIATEGYIAHLWASHADQTEIVVTSRRVTPDRIEFTATRKS